MLHVLHEKIQRVSVLITEYDEDVGRNTIANPALHDFVQKIKVILNAETEIARNHETNLLDTVSETSSSLLLIDAIGSNNNPKVMEAFGNHAVLTEILKYGTFRDKNFRLISKQWKGIANSIIIEKRLWKLRFDEKFGGWNYNRDGALSELNVCIEASGGSFPLTTIDFSDLDDYNLLNTPALRRFYKLIGQSIKSVKFNNFGSVTMKEFRDLLVNKMPNVDHIDAGKIVFTNKKRCLLRIVLPHLKTIQVICDKPGAGTGADEAFQVQPYYKVLLLAATNLEEILNFRIHLTYIVIEAGKFHCVQKFDFTSELEAMSDLRVKFCLMDPKLKSLSITRKPFEFGDDVDFRLSPGIVEDLKRILNSSKDTLKYLLCVPRVFPRDFQLPKLPNVEFFTVFDNDTSDADIVPRIFPPGCNCSEIFPNLHTVSVINVSVKDEDDDSSESVYKYFQEQKFPFVKTVTLQYSFQLGRSMTTNFPNVSHIKIIDYESIFSRTKESDFSTKAFHCELDNQIESLEFHLCRVLARSGPEFQLDSLFTGVPAKICAKLFKIHNKFKSGYRYEDENVMLVKKILQVVQTRHYAFRNSKGLRRVKLLFNHQDNRYFRLTKNSQLDWDSKDGSGSDTEEVKLWNPVITPVSFIYGFSLMPNLEQVIIGYDHLSPNASVVAQVIQPFAQFPYVEIVHKPTTLARSD